MRHAAIWLVAWSIVTVRAPAHAESYHYTAVDWLLGDGAQLTGINASGQVSGWYAERAFRWDRDVVLALSTINSRAAGLNDDGDVVGVVVPPSGLDRPVMWRADGIVVQLDDGYAMAQMINNAGQVVGSRHMPNYPFWEVVLWEPDLTRVHLGVFEGVNSTTARAYDVNDAGEVVGTCFFQGSSTDFGHRATLWQDGVWSDLGRLPNYGTAVATGINDFGVVVGYNGEPSLPPKSFRWEAGVLSELVGLNGVATGINNEGQIIAIVGNRGYVWDDGTLIDLGGPASSGRGIEPIAINDAGEVIGQGPTGSFLALPSRFPVADPRSAGVSERTLHGYAPIQLDGSGSTDDASASGDLAFHWWIHDKPVSSAASLVGASTSAPSFALDAIGRYVIGLVVSDEDGQRSAPRRVIVTSTNLAPSAVLTASAHQVGHHQPVTFDGATSSDPEGDPLTYGWSLVKPPGSAAVIEGSGATRTLVPDLAGSYEITLRVTDSFGASHQTTDYVFAVTGAFVAQMLRNADLMLSFYPDSAFAGATARASLQKRIQRAAEAAERENVSAALNAIEQVQIRTDGIPLRGQVDEKGAEADWVLDYELQLELWSQLESAKFWMGLL